MERLEPLGVYLSRVMAARDVTASDLAARLGVSRRAVEQWKRSERWLPEARAIQIAEALGVDPQELIGRQAAIWAQGGED